jgi:adenylate cyclase
MQNKRNRGVRLEGALCAEARARKGFSREHLASASRGGLSVATIKRLEGGAAVYLDTARRFAALVDVPLDTLVAGAATEPPAVLTESPATIAVLPFAVLGDGEDGRWFGEGLVEDVMTRLGRQWFPVIARGSTFRYRDVAPEPHVLHTELGADYAIEGSVRRAADKIRITARLTDTKSGHQVWASAFDKTLGDVFALQDELVSKIVGRAHGAILEKEARPLVHRDPEDLSAWELALRGSFFFHMRTRDGNDEARAMFEQALRRESHLALAWYFLAMTHQRAIINQWTSRPKEALEEMKRVCADFARFFPGEPRLHVASAYCGVYSGDRASAASHLLEAIDLDPNSHAAYSLYGQTLAMGNEPDEAIEQFELAMRLSPRDSELWSVQAAVALCHFVADRYGDMLRWAGLAIQSRNDMPFPHGIVAVAHAYLGNEEAARTAAQRMIALEPKTSMRGAQAIVGATNPEIAARYLHGLRKAGVPG